MSKQNIYDNQTFFDGYQKIRNNEINANNLFEIPALFSLLPDLKNKKILDLGCGYGEHCLRFIENGASKVVGIDISEKMLEVAKSNNSHPSITYLNLPIENIEEIDESFDIIISSLALHYVENFDDVVRKIYKKLNNNGLFIFSQEHPVNTCFTEGERWTKNENGFKIYAHLSNYGVEGERKSFWFVDGVKKYHRSFSTLINTLIYNGFRIDNVVEPIPSHELLVKYPQFHGLLHKPDFLLIKTRKCEG